VLEHTPPALNVKKMPLHHPLALLDGISISADTEVDSPFDSLSLQKSVLVHGRSNPPHPPDTVAIVKLHYLPESACQGDLDTTDLSSSRTTRVSEEKLFLHDAQQEGSCPISRGIAHLFQRRAGRSRRPVTPGFLRVSGRPSGPS
jgi:hypothetical protein